MNDDEFLDVRRSSSGTSLFLMKLFDKRELSCDSTELIADFSAIYKVDRQPVWFSELGMIRLGMSSSIFPWLIIRKMYWLYLCKKKALKEVR